MANEPKRILRASLGTLPKRVKDTATHVAARPDPPIAGVPESHNGRALAWTLRKLEPWECVSCGLPQKEYMKRKTVEAVLCGRCAMILADAAGPQEDPLLPEERAVMNRRKARSILRKK